MGSDARATLFYGICWNEEGEIWDMGKDWDDVDHKDERDFDKRYADLKGVHEPEIEYNYDPKVQKLYSDYWDEKRKLVDALSVDVGNYGSGEGGCTSPYLYIKESAMSTEWDSGLEIPTTSLQTKEQWDKDLKDICELLDIQWQEPKWWLVAYYG